jgi:hypothetical protein
MADVPLVRRDLLTTKGDLFVFDGTNLVRVGVGSDDNVLTADSAQSAGVKWAAGGGGGGGWVELGRWDHSVDGDTTSIEFTGIPQDYRDLVVRARLRSDASGSYSTGAIRFGDGSFDSGGSSYSYATKREGNTVSLVEGQGNELLIPAYGLSDSNPDAGRRAFNELTIHDYAETGDVRSVTTKGFAWAQSSARQRVIGGGAWNNTADPLERIQIRQAGGDDWNLGIVVLYGVG